MRTQHVVASLVWFALSSMGCREQPTLVHVHTEIAVEPSMLDFGEVLLGTSKTLSLDVYNLGDDVIRVCVAGTEHARCQAQASGIRPAGSPFSVAFEGLGEERKAWNVEKGAVRQLLVTYTPVAEGPSGATLVLIHDADNGPSTLIEITGSSVGPRIALSDATLDFGDVSVGQRRELQLTFTNETSFATPVRLELEAQRSVEFGVSGIPGDAASEPLSATVPGDGALSITVWFEPTGEGDRTNTLQVSFCDGCSVQVPLTGAGIKPYFVLRPAFLDFGSLPEGTPASRTFAIDNAGATNLTVESVALDGISSAEFQVLPGAPLPAVLSPGRTLDVAVTYVGVTPGLDEGTVLVRTDAWDDPATATDERNAEVALSAESIGPDVDAVPKNVQVGTVEVGSSAVRNVLLTNAGNAGLTISGLRLDTGTGEVTVAGAPTLPALLAPGDSVVVTIAYAPVDTGADAATLVVTSNDQDESTLAVPISGSGGVANACTVAVAPGSVQFGLVDTGRTVTLGLRIDSVGGQPCSLGSFVSSGDPALSVESPGALTLAPGESRRVMVSYAPAANGNHAGTLSFTSNDPSQPVVSIPLSGASFPTDLVVNPSAVDFGLVPTGCQSALRYVTIYNTGSAQETISSIYLDPSSSAELVLNPAGAPMTLPPGTQATVSLRYRPTDIGDDIGVLFVQHTGAQVPVAVPLIGRSNPNAVATDTYVQQPTPADVLFVVDNSCSMMEEQASLGANLGAFLSFAQGQGVDYQIAVTTTDVESTGEEGRFVGSTRIITPTTPNAAQVFQSNVNVGIYGATAEQGLEAAYMALSPGLLNGHNAGFLRPHAALAVVFVSDEEDQSTRALSFYQSFFGGVKPDGNFTVSAIVGTTNPECNSPNGLGDYAPRYINVASGAGGVVESICSSNWGQSLANIGIASFGLRRSFSLSSQPVPSTVAVRVDGVLAPAGIWSYQAATNAVAFTGGNVPPAYATVEVTYSVQCL